MKSVSASRLTFFSAEGEALVSIGQEAAVCLEEKDFTAWKQTAISGPSWPLLFKILTESYLVFYICAYFSKLFCFREFTIKLLCTSYISSAGLHISLM